jgi:hypothetical protein
MEEIFKFKNRPKMQGKGKKSLSSVSHICKYDIILVRSETALHTFEELDNLVHTSVETITE